MNNTFKRNFNRLKKLIFSINNYLEDEITFMLISKTRPESIFFKGIGDGNDYP